MSVYLEIVKSLMAKGYPEEIACEMAYGSARPDCYVVTVYDN